MRKTIDNLYKVELAALAGSLLLLLAALLKKSPFLLQLSLFLLAASLFSDSLAAWHARNQERAVLQLTRACLLFFAFLLSLFFT